MSDDHNKLCKYSHYHGLVERSSDEEILDGIRDQDWMHKEWGIHRYYLRLLLLEARKRGLGT